MFLPQLRLLVKKTHELHLNHKPKSETHEVFVKIRPFSHFSLPFVDAPTSFHQGYGHGQCLGVVRRRGSGFHHSEFQIAECAVESHVDGWCGCRDLVEIHPDTVAAMGGFN